MKHVRAYIRDHDAREKLENTGLDDVVHIDVPLELCDEIRDDKFMRLLIKLD